MFQGRASEDEDGYHMNDNHAFNSSFTKMGLQNTVAMLPEESQDSK